MEAAVGFEPENDGFAERANRTGVARSIRQPRAAVQVSREAEEGETRPPHASEESCYWGFTEVACCGAAVPAAGAPPTR